MNKILMTKKKFKEVMQVLTKASKEDTRPILKGVCFKGNEVVAIDGHRLSIRHLESELDVECVVDSNDLKEVVKACKSNVEYVEIIFNEDEAVFSLFDKGKVLINTIIGKYLAGRYLNYKSLLPQKFTGVITINDTKKILDIIKPIKNKDIVLEVEENILSIYAVDVVGEPKKERKHLLTLIDSIELKEKTQVITVAVNTKYLKDALKGLNSFAMSYTNKVSPIVIEEKNKYEMLLPIRLVGDIEKVNC